jgi:uncharacterized protein (TIGR01777 family)
MRIVIAGGTGQVGRILSRAFVARGDTVTILSRSAGGADSILWDGKSLGEWIRYLDGADVIINLAGCSVNCRYTAWNRGQILDSRVDSVRAIGLALPKLQKPPGTWLQASTATIYAHRFDVPNDEINGIIGGREPGAPDTWRFSIDVATAWERALNEAAAGLPHIRAVLMRSAMIMSPDRGGIFAMLRRLVRLGLGGTAGSGKQFVSWIHEYDFVRAVDYLIRDERLTGPVNVCSPKPMPNREFMAELRKACGMPVGLPASKLMLEIGAFFMRTETELILKSRRVVPKRLLDSGFQFKFPNWADAARDLCRRYRVQEKWSNGVNSSGVVE